MKWTEITISEGISELMRTSHISDREVAHRVVVEMHKQETAELKRARKKIKRKKLIKLVDHPIFGTCALNEEGDLVRPIKRVVPLRIIKKNA